MYASFPCLKQMFSVSLLGCQAVMSPLQSLATRTGSGCILCLIATTVTEVSVHIIKVRWECVCSHNHLDAHTYWKKKVHCCWLLMVNRILYVHIVYNEHFLMWLFMACLLFLDSFAIFLFSFWHPAFPLTPFNYASCLQLSSLSSPSLTIFVSLSPSPTLLFVLSLFLSLG